LFRGLGTCQTRPGAAQPRAGKRGPGSSLPRADRNSASTGRQQLQPHAAHATCFLSRPFRQSTQPDSQPRWATIHGPTRSTPSPTGPKRVSPRKRAPSIWGTSCRPSPCLPGLAGMRGCLVLAPPVLKSEPSTAAQKQASALLGPFFAGWIAHMVLVSPHACKARRARSLQSQSRGGEADPALRRLQFGVVQSQFSAYIATTLYKKDPVRTKVRLDWSPGAAVRTDPSDC